MNTARRHALGATIASLLAPLLVACGGDEGDREGSALASEPVIVTRDAEALPRDCRPEAVGRLANGFTRALKEADGTALSTIWSGRFAFFTYGIGTSERVRGFTARSAEEAARRVEELGGIDIRLSELRINDRDADYGGVDVEYNGTWRHGSPAGRGRELVGKGFVNCGGRGTDPSIRVWAMALRGRPVNRPSLDLCPDPKEQGDELRGRLVACARGRG